MYYIDLTIYHPDVSVFGGHKTSTLRITYEPIQDACLGFIQEETPSAEEISGGVVHILHLNANCIETKWLERFRERKIETTQDEHGLFIKFGDGTWGMTHPLLIAQ